MPSQLLLALGVMFLGPAMTQTAGSLGRRGTVASAAFGIGLILIAAAWSSIAPHLSTVFVHSFVSVSANGYVWLGMLTAAWIYFAVKNLIFETRIATEGSLAKLPPKVIVLQSPREGERVVHEATVRGFVYPASSKPVQILIQSGAPNDLWWYPQLPEPRIEGYEWIKDHCAFGYPNSPGGTRHSIVAISSSQAVTQRTKELPPDAIRSNVVTVYRY
jgi:hypothetical protein